MSTKGTACADYTCDWAVGEALSSVTVGNRESHQRCERRHVLTHRSTDKDLGTYTRASQRSTTDKVLQSLRTNHPIVERYLTALIAMITSRITVVM